MLELYLNYYRSPDIALQPPFVSQSYGVQKGLKLNKYYGFYGNGTAAVADWHIHTPWLSLPSCCKQVHLEAKALIFFVHDTNFIVKV